MDYKKRGVSKEEAKLTQAIRLLDIFVIGPVLIYAGIKGNINNNLKAILIIIAILTIAYNAYYLLKK